VQRPKATALQQRRRECEQVACKGLEDEDPNCALSCTSPGCFDSFYKGNELEPGEIDSARRKLFDACARDEERTARG